MAEDNSELRFSALINLASFLSVTERKELICVLAGNLHMSEIQNISEHDQEHAAHFSASVLDIPASIFREKELSCLESIVKFLKEDKGLSVSEIAKILNRSPKTIWSTYSNTKRKFEGGLDSSGYAFSIPLALFEDRNFSVFELVVYYLKDVYSLSFKSIAGMVNRDYKTVYTIFTRAKGKIMQ